MNRSLFGILIIALCTLTLTGFALAANRLANPGFELWTGHGVGGPPDNWGLGGSFGDSSHITAIQEAALFRSGSYSVEVTWDTTDTKWLHQIDPISADSCYEFSCWAYDTAAYGRARVCLVWYDSTDTNQLAGYYGDYTTDQAAWQLMSSGAQLPPAGAKFAHCELRVYDVNWSDTTATKATIFFDDAFFDTVSCPVTPDSVGIYDIQYATLPGGLPPDTCYPSTLQDSVRFVRGIVTHVLPGTYPDFWLQDAEAPWSGVFFYDYTVDPVVGDEIRISAQAVEYYGLTEMQNVVADFQIVSHGNPLPSPLKITTSDLAGGCNAAGEAYEGVLCRLDSVICTQAPNVRNEWYVTDFAGTDTCQIDDFTEYAYNAAVGDTFNSITGLVHYSYGEYELGPRGRYDVNPRTLPGPKITGISHTPTIPGEGWPVTVMASIYDPAGAKAIASDSVFYQVNDTTGAWTTVGRTSADEHLHYYTILPDDPEIIAGDTVYFYVHAEIDTGGPSDSPIHKYLVLEDYPQIKINEFMYNSPGADSGCFIELRGPSNESLNGWSLVMVNGYDGTDKIVIDLTGQTIPPDGFFVVAQDNGVANFDTVTTNANFENGPDNIHLRKDGFLYDAVGYGSFAKEEYFVGETWPTYNPGYPYGFSLGRYPDGSDSDYNRKDFGVYGSAYNTPGTGNHAPVEYTIAQIQNPSAKPDYEGKRVIVGGTVTVDTACTYNPGYYIEMSAGGYWSGVLVYDLFNEPTRGDTVQVTGTVYDDYGRTQISYITKYTNAGSGVMPSPMVAPTAEVAVAESLEGVLVEVQSVEVVDSLGYGEFLIADGTAVGDTCMLDDICGYPYQMFLGDRFVSIRGVVDYSFGNFMIQPRDDNDFVKDLNPTSLTVMKSSDDIQLLWAPADASYFVIYRGTDPSTSGDSLDEAAGSATSYLDVGAAGNTMTNYYYVVQARFPGKTTDSRMVGEFDKSLSNVK